MAFTTLEKSYGGYSTHSVRNAEPNKDRNVPKYVTDKADHFVDDKGYDESKAWAVAWSIYCKYKEPGSKHCKKEKGEYFKNRKAYPNKKEYERAKRQAKYISGIMHKKISRLLIAVYSMLEDYPERIQDIVMWKWTRGVYPQSFNTKSMIPKYVGQVSHLMNEEMRPSGVTKEENHKANKILWEIFKFINDKWSDHLYASLSDKFEGFLCFQIRMEILAPANRIMFAIPYSRILLELFPDSLFPPS
jgi:hypothetical protein